MDALFDELQRVFDWIKIKDAKLAFRELVEYSLAGKFLHHSAERFQATMSDKAKSFLAAWNVLYELCQEEECARKHLPIPNAYDRQMQESVEATHHIITAKRSRGRPVSVSLKTKLWMVKQWDYLGKHPEACSANVGGVKVTYLDFWETFENALRERGITSQEQAARALKTALANHREGLLG